MREQETHTSAQSHSFGQKYFTPSLNEHGTAVRIARSNKDHSNFEKRVAFESDAVAPQIHRKGVVEEDKKCNWSFGEREMPENE